eukprot:gnl/TRDRNA2_/TRDRNA2_120874_c0_seq1.p4 gnl/TRDRNA2_/TRDRNA2_120874_c0~~gnl/TRDRNA2_/TRDRNA2_120874_c0_seq1.p4  ORF type:complete len:106 (-),score=9.85 gnl/TRDRNA2_/TRDRNA2_120874_c0_seq1:84-401(-)
MHEQPARDNTYPTTPHPDKHTTKVRTNKFCQNKPPVKMKDKTVTTPNAAPNAKRVANVLFTHDSSSQTEASNKSMPGMTNITECNDCRIAKFEIGESGPNFVHSW